MPVTAGVISDLPVITGWTNQYVPTQRRTAATLDGRHHLELTETDVALMGLAPDVTMVAENVRDLQRRMRHARLSSVLLLHPVDWSPRVKGPWRPAHRAKSFPVFCVRARPE